MKKYIHYGHKHFDRRRFEPIRNDGYFGVKPDGGFWASPIDAEYGWRDWNEESKFVDCSKKNSFTFSLAPTANVLVIDNKDKLCELPQRPSDGVEPPWFALDFEAIKNSGVDVIEYVLSSDPRLYWALYGWDCDSILVMNPDVVVED